MCLFQFAKVALCGACGIPMGFALAGFYLPFHWLISIEFGIISTLALCFLSLGLSSISDIHLQLPWLFSLFVAMFPVTWMTLPLHLNHPRHATGGVDYMAVARMLLLTCYSTVGFALALLLKVYNIACCPVKWMCWRCNHYDPKIPIVQPRLM